MSVTVQVPSMLRGCCGGAAELSVSAFCVREALAEIEHRYPLLYGSVCDETGAVRRHINLFVNASLLRGRERLDADLAPGDVLAIMPAVSGG